MATLSHPAFRILMEKFGGCDEYYTEMINAPSLLHGGQFEKFYINPAPVPEKLVWQLTGKSAEPMIAASSMLCKLGGIGVDLNMGCSAPEIFNSGAGCAWMIKDRGETEELLSGVHKALCDYENETGKLAELTRLIAGAGISVQKAVVGTVSVNESFGIFSQTLLLILITHQVLQHDTVCVVDGNELQVTALFMAYPEGSVQSEHSDSVLFIEAGQYFEGSLCVFHVQSSKFIAEIPHLLTDVSVIHLLLLGDRMVVRYHRKAVDLQILFHGAEVVVHEPQKDTEIRLGKAVHRPVACPHLLTGESKRIFVGDKQESQIISPKVLVKSIVCAKVQQSPHFSVSSEDQSVQLRPLIAPGSVLKILCFSYYFTNVIQYAVLSEIPEHHQPGYFLVHHVLPYGA